MDEGFKHMSNGNISIANVNSTVEPIKADRRTFLRTATLIGCASFLTGIPLISYLIAPAMKKGTGKWVDFGATEDLEAAGFQMLAYEFMVKDGWLVLPQRGFVWAKAEVNDQFKIFSSTCTHLACNVIWRDDTQSFECPCHSGKFDADGNPVAGPPTRALSTLEHKIDEGNLLVYLTF
jgi:Rieske Fe-S protein